MVESFVWLVPVVRIDRLVVLSLDSMDRGAWPFSVGGVICLVNSVSVCVKRREKREERREERGEKMKDERVDKEIKRK